MPSPETLTKAALRLAEAVARHEMERTVQSADEVIAARLAVKEAFIEAGWQPSDRAIRQMQADRELLRESPGILDRRSDSQRTERSASRHVVPSGARVVHVGGRVRPRRTPMPWLGPLPGLA